MDEEGLEDDDDRKGRRRMRKKKRGRFDDDDDDDLVSRKRRRKGFDSDSGTIPTKLRRQMKKIIDEIIDYVDRYSHCFCS